MNIYVVMECTAYGGAWLLAAFKTRRKAKAYVKKTGPGDDKCWLEIERVKLED